MVYKIFKLDLFKTLSNLTFAIILLLIIALFSVTGTIIEQNKSLEYYQIKYPISANMQQAYIPTQLNWQIIKNYQLDQIYSSLPFLTLIIIFSISLILCTFSTQLPSLKYAKRWKFRQASSKQHELYQQQYNHYITHSSIIYKLCQLKYYNFYQKQCIYSYKGLAGKIAPIFVHFSIILLLIGSLTSIFTSFYLQEMIPVGEHFNLQNTAQSGLFSKIPEELTGKVNDFSIEYYPNKSIKQFYSSVTMYNHKTDKVYKKLISVNDPMQFEGLTIYQTDWKIYGLRINIDNQIIQIPVTKLINNNQTYWGTTFIANNQRYSIILSGLNNSIMCYDKNGQFLTQLTIDEKRDIDNITIQIKSILTSTGLQIKQDGGLYIVYSSFFLLIISIIISYFSYSQLWIITNMNSINISGKTNRGHIHFEYDLLQIMIGISKSCKLIN
uniref:Cytochrome c biogenesis protein Ccs1 n=1 Tax=Galaxaura rugosa TaxID=268570 RepID=A0A1G4NSK3_9FLOR|nr:Cytochrome c biogenesis protein ccs1 [Galaxaura rugosa]SCW21662.1 Cytochrome c biogenesis protein ccs1 [Galaxaura rugosa]